MVHEAAEAAPRGDAAASGLAICPGGLRQPRHDPKQLLVWYPLAEWSRKLFPDAFKHLDAAAGGVFPFSKEQLKAAHSRWTADWLAWERAHDAEYSLKTAQVQDEIDRAQGQASPLSRTRLAAIEQQKLERYQHATRGTSRRQGARGVARIDGAMYAW